MQQSILRTGPKLSRLRYYIRDKFQRLLLIMLLFTLFSVLSLPRSHASNVDLSSELYHDLERLSAYGLIDSAILGTRPIDRLTAAMHIQEALRKYADTGEDLNIPGSIVDILNRLKYEFRDDIEEIEKRRNYIKPVTRGRLSYSYLNGEESRFLNVNASQLPFNYNNEGQFLRKSSLLMDLEGEARYKKLSFYLKPDVTFNNFEDLDVGLQKIYGKFYFWKLSLEIGKDSLWWGQGRHGSLILTNNAEPFSLLKISNEVPFVLPVLGLFKMDFFLTKLGKDRVYPRPYLGGLRFSFKPRPWLEFGLTRTAITGGSGSSGIDFGDIGTILIGKNLGSKEEGESNQIAGGDIRIRIAPLKAFIYGEAAGEDEAGGLPYKWAYIGGIYFADLYGADLRIEYADTASGYSGWYTHSSYEYTYKGRLMGHHMGGDARDTFVGTSFSLDRNTRLSFHYDYEKRGVSNPNPETHYEFVVGLKRRISRFIKVTLRSGFEKVTNHSNTAGNDKNNSFIELSLLRNF
jgi:hypothetical protein